MYILIFRKGDFIFGQSFYVRIKFRNELCYYVQT